jgi:hypothetical protein
MTKKWESYEQVARHLLDQMASAFGLERVEEKQAVVGLRSGTSYVIDAKGVIEGGQRFVIIECRRFTTSRQKQEQVGGLAYRIIDAGAAGGILVTPLGLQEGAAKIASAEHIISVQLAENSTTTDYVLKFLNQLHAGASKRINVTERAVAVLRNEATGKETRIERAD